MTFFESTLIYVAKAVLAFWDLVKTFFGWVGAALESILQPLLSPLLRVLNPICTFIADATYKLFKPFPPWVGLVVISAVAGVVMLIAFRYLSNQKGIARAKDDIKANLLALKLFKDDLRVALRAQGRILWALVRLQRYILVPVLWMALPTMLLLAQMAMRYQWRPPMPGEKLLLKVYSPSAAMRATSARIEPNDGLEVEAGPIAASGDFAWRIRAVKPGRHTIFIHAGTTWEKEIVVGGPIQRVSRYRPGPNWTMQLLYPIESPLELATSSEGVEIYYPEQKSYIFGSGYWAISFFVISMLTAILLKPLFKVRF